jgi:hypothetical protein
MLDRNTRRWVAVGLLLVVGGCAGTQGPGLVMGSQPLFPPSLAPAPATPVVWDFEPCGYHVVFSGKPEHDQKLETGTTGFDTVQFLVFKSNTAVEAAFCLRKGSVDFSSVDLNAIVASKFATGTSKVAEMSSYAGENGIRIYDIVGSITAPNGTGVGNALRIIVDRTTLVGLFFASPANQYNPQLAYRFVGSAAGRAPLPKTPPTQPPGFEPMLSTEDVAQLEALKQALDEKRITPAEYEAKRRAIIDGT